MASIPYAYSIELNDIIDAEQAYEAFWSGEIRDPSAFKCPDSDCDGQVTCINMEKPENDMLQSPHFRGYHHSNECQLANEKSSGSPSRGSSSGSGKRSELDELLLNRPTAPKSTSTNNQLVGIGGTSGTTSGKSTKTYRPKYFTIRSLVSKFVKHRKANEEKGHFIKIENENISYKDLFIGVYNQNVDKLPKVNRIYWGVAYLDKDDLKDYYTIRFAEAFEKDDKELRPTIFLPEKLIDSYHSKLIRERIKLYSKIKPPKAIVFIYAKPLPPKEKDGKTYVNFKVENLDLLDIRGLEFFEKLKRE